MSKNTLFITAPPAADAHPVIDVEPLPSGETATIVSALVTVLEAYSHLTPARWDVYQDTRKETVRETLSALRKFCVGIGWPLPPFVDALIIVTEGTK